MKIRNLVIGAVGLLSLGAVACGAEGGTGPETTGSSSAAATWNNTFDALPSSAVRYLGSACVVSDTVLGVTRDKLLFAGGFNNSGVAQSTAYLFDPQASGGSQWETLPSLATARGALQLIKVPGHTDRCLAMGGSSNDGAVVGGNALDSAEYIDMSDYRASSTGWTATSNAMSVSRRDFQVIECGSSKLLAVGGKLNATSETYRSALDVYDPSTNSWSTLKDGSNNTVTLGAARSAHTIAEKDTNFDKFIVAGGRNAGGVLATMELLTVNSSCASATRVNATTNMRVARQQAVSFQQGTTDTFLVTGGSSASSPSTGLSSSDQILVNNWTSNSANVTVSGTAGNPGGLAMSTARRLPIFSKLSTDRFILVGGLTNTSTTTTKTQAYDKSGTPQWENIAGTASAEDDLNTSRYGAAIGIIAGNAYIVGGHDGTNTLGSIERTP